MNLIWMVPVSGGIAVLFAIFLIRDVLRRDTGTPAMQDIAGRILEGATAFIKRQYRTIGLLAILAAIVVAVVVGALTDEKSLAQYNTTAWGIAWRTGFAFLLGATCSAISGIIGMYISVKSNLRCAAAAAKGGLRDAITVAIRGGAVSGFLVVALSLLGVAAIYYGYGGDPKITPHLIVGFGFGASFVALFAQLGGGIYTKAADMGADLVGKIEAGIPEDDPRHGAVTADPVGDNVGDCAGRGGENPMSALNRGYFVSIILSLGGMGLAVAAMLHNPWLFWAGAVGILTSVAVVYITQYYTEPNFRPAQE